MTESHLPSHPRTHHGPWVVTLIVLLCAAASYLAVSSHQAEVVATADARLLFNGQVIAAFKGAQEIKKGTPATVTVQGYGTRKFTGEVTLSEVEKGETTTIIQLAVPPKEVNPPVPCQVSIEKKL